MSQFNHKNVYPYVKNPQQYEFQVKNAKFQNIIFFLYIYMGHLGKYWRKAEKNPCKKYLIFFKNLKFKKAKTSVCGEFNSLKTDVFAFLILFLRKKIKFFYEHE